MNTLSPNPQKNTRALALAPVIGLAGIIALLAGCASDPVSHVVSAPPPPAPTVASGTVMATPTTTTQTTQTTQTSPNGTVVTTRTQPVNTVVTQTPPTAQTEVLSAQPTPAHKWISGYWTWRDNQYQWMTGRWEIPPYTAATWNAPRWVSESGGYRFYEGFWN